jgi:hypothetical protein
MSAQPHRAVERGIPSQPGQTAGGVNGQLATKHNLCLNVGSRNLCIMHCLYTENHLL